MNNQENPAPLHPFEIRIVIGACTWDYARRTMCELAEYFEERDPDHCGMASGGWDGSHSVDVNRRDVTPDKFREELEQWRQRMIELREQERWRN